MELNMISYKLQDLQFFNKLDKPGQVQLENNFSYSVDYNKENTGCVARLYQCVKDKSEDENHKFFVSVELLGVFQLTGPVTDEDKKDIHVQTYLQLFPYAELLVKQVCAAGGMPNFVLMRHKMDRDKVALNKKQ
jgi:preprotein translocase subunit SecB